MVGAASGTLTAQAPAFTGLTNAAVRLPGGLRGHKRQDLRASSFQADPDAVLWTTAVLDKPKMAQLLSGVRSAGVSPTALSYHRARRLFG
jgi:hypothetical protein